MRTTSSAPAAMATGQAAQLDEAVDEDVTSGAMGTDEDLRSRQHIRFSSSAASIEDHGDERRFGNKDGANGALPSDGESPSCWRTDRAAGERAADLPFRASMHSLRSIPSPGDPILNDEMVQQNSSSASGWTRLDRKTDFAEQLAQAVQKAPEKQAERLVDQLQHHCLEEAHLGQTEFTWDCPLPHIPPSDRLRDRKTFMHQVAAHFVKRVEELGFEEVRWHNGKDWKKSEGKFHILHDTVYDKHHMRVRVTWLNRTAEPVPQPAAPQGPSRNDLLEQVHNFLEAQKALLQGLQALRASTTDGMTPSSKDAGDTSPAERSPAAIVNSFGGLAPLEYPGALALPTVTLTPPPPPPRDNSGRSLQGAL